MIYLAWVGAGAVDGLDGPWLEARRAQDGLLVIDSEESRSVVYHALKHQLPSGTALLVTELAHVPKAKGLVAGTISWLRARLPT